MGLEEYKGVYIYAQQVDNQVSSIAFELIGNAKELAEKLGTDVTAVLLGSNVKALATDLAEYGADKVIVVDDPELETYRTEPYAHALASVINEYKPEIMLVGATAIGRDLGPTVSARVATGLTADCTVLEIGDFPLVAIPGKEADSKGIHISMSFLGGKLGKEFHRCPVSFYGTGTSAPFRVFYKVSKGLSQCQCRLCFFYFHYYSMSGMISLTEAPSFSSRRSAKRGTRWK